MNLGAVSLIVASMLTIPTFIYLEWKKRDDYRKAQEAKEAYRQQQIAAKAAIKAWNEYCKENEKQRKAEEKARQKAAEEARRAEANKPKIEDLARVLEAKTNLALALENAAGKETDPVKKAAMHERAARTYAQAHTISEKIDKLMEGRL